MMMLIVDHFKILTDSPTTTKAPGPDYSFSSLTAEFPFRFVPIDEISVPRYELKGSSKPEEDKDQNIEGGKLSVIDRSRTVFFQFN